MMLNKREWEKFVERLKLPLTNEDIERLKQARKVYRDMRDNAIKRKLAKMTLPKGLSIDEAFSIINEVLADEYVVPNLC